LEDDMRVLFASTPGAGHLGPLIPFATAIRRAGHELLVAAPISAQARVERAGLPFISCADPLERDLAPIWERVRAATLDEANRIVLGELFARVRAGAALPGLELAMDAWLPDVVVRESCEFASAVAAEARAIPVARVGAGLLASEAFAVDAAAPAVDDLRRWAGLEPDPAGERLAGSPYLTLTPASVELPGGPEPERTLRFHDARPPLRAVRSPDAVPLVYLSFGSVAPTMGFFPGLYRAVVDALAALPIRLLVTVGEAADPAALGPLPANVRVERWIPQAEVFTEADAMVGHGGFGTTLGALLAAVPQAVVPLFADQPHNAERIASLGAGLAADAEDPASVRAAVERLLAEPSFRVAAGRIALEAQSLPAIDEAPAALEALVAAQARFTPSRASSASASAR
jgi:UDP:flavonoid glycosyltransferase YjiC (YdhE family)